MTNQLIDSSKSILLVTCQVVNPAFVEWMEHFASEYGRVELWTGDKIDTSAPITVKPMPRYNKRSSLTRLIAWLSFTLVAIPRLLFLSRKVPVFVVTNPPLMPLLIVLFHRLTGRRYALLEYDIYPQVMSSMELISERNLIYRLWYRWHRWSLTSADVVITLGDSMAAELRSMLDEKSANIQIIPNWANIDWIQPIDRTHNHFLDAHDLQEKLVVLYSGNIGATHSIETIITVADLLKEQPDIQVLVIGGGVKAPLVQDAIDGGKVANLMFLPWQPKENLPFILSAANIAFVTLAPGYERLSMPSKTYNHLAAGNAIAGISYPPNDVSLTLKKHGCGRNFCPDEAQQIADWILQLYNDRDQLQRLQSASRQAAEDHYNSVVCHDLLDQVMKTHLVQDPI